MERIIMLEKQKNGRTISSREVSYVPYSWHKKRIYSIKIVFEEKDNNNLNKKIMINNKMKYNKNKNN